MLLAIDVRNTHTVIGLISGSGDHAKVVQHWRIRTESEVTSDELALTLDGLIGDDSERLTGAAGLSTVPSVLHEVRLMLEQYWPSVPHVLIEPGVRTGIPLLVDNPKEVGADRIVNCLAAFHKYNSAAIVVDFGSSICVDVVSAKGEFLGGAIAPGVQVSSDAAAARSAALRRVELHPAPFGGRQEHRRVHAVRRRVRIRRRWSTAWSPGSARTSTASPVTTSRWWPPATPLLSCCPTCTPSTSTTSTSPSTACDWCSSATATARAAG